MAKKKKPIPRKSTGGDPITFQQLLSLQHYGNRGLCYPEVATREEELARIRREHGRLRNAFERSPKMRALRNEEARQQEAIGRLIVRAEKDLLVLRTTVSLHGLTPAVLRKCVAILKKFGIDVSVPGA